MSEKGDNKSTEAKAEDVRRHSVHDDDDDYEYVEEVEAPVHKSSESLKQGVVAERKSDSGDSEEYVEDEEEVPGKEDQAAGDSNKTKAAKEEKAKLLKKKELAGYKIRPDLEDKFRPGLVQALMEKIVKDNLDGQVYDPQEMPNLVKSITAEIQHKIKAQKYNRYKLVTCVVLGERRGEGVSSATRCVWDAEADCLATYTYLSETIFCCATVYGIYYY